MSIWIAHQGRAQHCRQAGRKPSILFEVHVLIPCPQWLSVLRSAQVASSWKWVDLLLRKLLKHLLNCWEIEFGVLIVNFDCILDGKRGLRNRICFWKINHHPRSISFHNCFPNNRLEKFLPFFIIKVEHRCSKIWHWACVEHLSPFVLYKIIPFLCLLVKIFPPILFGWSIAQHWVDINENSRSVFFKLVLQWGPFWIIILIQLPIPP